jgi:hypothetical protein
MFILGPKTLRFAYSSSFYVNIGLKTLLTAHLNKGGNPQRKIL